MKELLLAIFLIIFGCKLIGVPEIIYKSTGMYPSMDPQHTLPSEELELQMESDEQNENKLGEDEVYFFLPGRHYSILITFSFHKTIFLYFKPFSGFITQLFTPPDPI